MREIKFRAWIKQDDDYFMAYNIQNIYDGMNDESGKLGGVSSFHSFLDEEDVKVMQFTGLKDKNGKEIYEGDILSNGSKSGKVIFHRCAFMVEEKNGQGILSSYIQADFEVMGNIYENPEII